MATKRKGATFKAGDRVRLIDSRWGACVEGDEGTVLGPDLPGGFEYQVEFDRCPTNRHYLDGNQIEAISPLNQVQTPKEG